MINCDTKTVENQVCDFTLCEKLQNIGVTEKGYFVWFKLKENSEWSVSENWQIDDEERFDCIPAFTAAELMELLPACINTRKDEPFNYFYLVLQKRTTPNIRYILNYNCDTYAESDCFPRILIPHNIYDSNLANCLAKSLLWVKENGYL